MPHPPEYYTNLRNQYTPKGISLIFLLESPPTSGNYFYSPDGSTTEPLYLALMEYLNINEATKGLGLKKFCERGYLLVDATYLPVNDITNNVVRNQTILQNYENLKEDFINLGALEKQTPIVLVKANIYDLFINLLPGDGFNVVNGQNKIPFPSTGQQGNFRWKIKELSEIGVINRILADSVHRKHYMPYNIPKAYCDNVNNVKAFVLGADPSNFSDVGRTSIIKTVFDLPNGDKRYFAGILKNLRLLDLEMNSIYVQNIVRNYMDEETNKNKNWIPFAKMWIPQLAEDMNKIDPQKRIPVFATGEIILNSLLRENAPRYKPAEYYERNIIHPPNENILERNLIPCFRHYAYAYDKHSVYVNYIKSFMV